MKYITGSVITGLLGIIFYFLYVFTEDTPLALHAIVLFILSAEAHVISHIKKEDE